MAARPAASVPEPPHTVLQWGKHPAGSLGLLLGQRLPGGPKQTFLVFYLSMNGQLVLGQSLVLLVLVALRVAALDCSLKQRLPIIVWSFKAVGCCWPFATVTFCRLLLLQCIKFGATDGSGSCHHATAALM